MAYRRQPDVLRWAVEGLLIFPSIHFSLTAHPTLWIARELEPIPLAFEVKLSIDSSIYRKKNLPTLNWVLGYVLPCRFPISLPWSLLRVLRTALILTLTLTNLRPILNLMLTSNLTLTLTVTLTKGGRSRLRRASRKARRQSFGIATNGFIIPQPSIQFVEYVHGSHTGQVNVSSQGWHREINNQPHSHRQTFWSCKSKLMWKSLVLW